MLFIDHGVEDSYLLGLLERIFAEQSGVTESIDNTTWNPKEQLNEKFNYIPVDITIDDEYDSKGRKQNFEQFVSGAEESIESGNLREFLMRIVSQLISSEALDKKWSLYIGDLFFKDDADDEFVELRKNYIPRYQRLIAEFSKNKTPKVLGKHIDIIKLIENQKSKE